MQSGILDYQKEGWYEGEIKGGEMHGIGTYHFPDGKTYRGETDHGKNMVRGTWNILMAQLMKESLEKIFLMVAVKKNSLTAQSIKALLLPEIFMEKAFYHFQTGYRKGHSVNNHLEGFSESSINNTRYYGLFKNDIHHGAGTFDCDFFDYVGEFENVFFHGKGIIHTVEDEDGYQEYFKGNFRLGIKHGEGKTKYPDAIYSEHTKTAFSMYHNGLNSLIE